MPVPVVISHYHEPRAAVSLPGRHFAERIGGRVIVAGPRRLPLLTRVDITSRHLPGGRMATLKAIIGDRTARRYDSRFDVPRQTVLRVWGQRAVVDGLLRGTVQVLGRARR